MGLFDSFFKKKQGSVSVELEKAVEFAKSSVQAQKTDLERFVASKLAEVKRLLKEIRQTLGSLKSAKLEKQNEKLSKIVKTARGNMIKQLTSLVEKLEPVEEPRSLNAIRSYCFESQSVLNREIQQFGKNIAYTSIYLKEEVKQLGAQINELNKIFSLMAKEFEGKKGVFAVESVAETVKQLRHSIEKASSLNQSIESSRKELEGVQRDQKTLQEELASIKKSENFLEIDGLETRKARIMHKKQSLKTETINLFASIDNPLKKFFKAVESGRIVLEAGQQELLREFILNPFMALKRDPKAELLKGILLELKNAIESNQVSLKEREREKRLSALDELLVFDFFENVFSQITALDSELLQVEKQLSSKSVFSEIDAIKSKHLALKKRASELEPEIEENNSAIASTQGAIESAKSRLESLLSEISGKQVSVRVP